MLSKVCTSTLLMIFCTNLLVLAQTNQSVPPQNARPPILNEPQFREMLNSISEQDSILELYVRFSQDQGRRNPSIYIDLVQEIEANESFSELNKRAYSNYLKAAYWNRSNIDSSAHYYSLAIQQFRALDRDFRVIDAMQQLARVTSRNNEFIEAEEIYYELLEYLEDVQVDENIKQNIYNELTDLYIRVGAIEIAIERYNQLLELGPQSPNAECNLRLKMSNAYKRNQEINTAYDELMKCADRENVNDQLKASIYRSLADLEKIRGNQENRLNWVIKAADLVTPQSSMYFGTNLFLGEAFFDNGMYNKADSVIIKLDQYDFRRVQLPARINYLILKTKQRLQSQDFDEAIRTADEGLELGARMPQALLNVDLQRLKAEALQQKGEYEEAFELLKSISEHEQFIEKTGRVQMEEMSKVRFQMRAKNLELEAINAKLSLVRFRTFTIILLLLILSGFLVYRYRLKSALQEERTRTKIANDLHDEVSATLTGITYFAEAVKQDPDAEKKSHFLNLIAESAGDAKEKITDIVWSITPEYDNWELLLSKCRRFASDLFESKNIDYELDIDKKIDGKLDMNVRQHIWMIYKELVTNAVRHAQATEIKVSLLRKKNRILLSISDNGCGFDTHKKFEGNGLKNIKHRADKLKADFSLDSSKNEGTQCTISIPI